MSGTMNIDLVDYDKISILNVDDSWYIFKDKKKYYIPFDFYHKICNDDNIKISYKSEEGHIIEPVNANTDIILRPYQEICYKQFLEFMSLNNNCFMHCIPGFGKTIFSINHIVNCINNKNINGYILIMCDSDTLLQQWGTAINIWTNLKYTRAEGKKYRVVNKKKILKEVEYERIILSTTTMTKHISKYVKNHISMMVMDEIDTLCTHTKMKRILKISPKYVIGLSATKKRSDGRDVFIDFMFSDNEITTPMPPVDIRYVKTNIVIPARGNSRLEMWHNYLKDITYNIERNILIATICEMFYTDQILSDNNKIIMFCRRNIHIKILSDTIIEYFTDCGYSIINEIKSTQTITVDSEKQKIEMYEYFEIVKGDLVIRVCNFCAKIGLTREADLTITNEKKGSRGIDEVNLCPNHSGVRSDTCFFAVSMKDERPFIQALGRAFRSDTPASIHMEDINSTSINHLKENLKTFKKYDMIQTISKILI